MKFAKISQGAMMLALCAMASMVIPACSPSSAGVFTAPTSATPKLHVNVVPGNLIVGGSLTPQSLALHTWTFTAAQGEVVQDIHIQAEYLYVPTGQPNSQYPAFVTAQMTVPGVDPENGGIATVIVGQAELVTLIRAPGRYVQFHVMFHPNPSGVFKEYFQYPDATTYTIKLQIATQPEFSADVKSMQLQVLTVPVTQVDQSASIGP